MDTLPMPPWQLALIPPPSASARFFVTVEFRITSRAAGAERWIPPPQMPATFPVTDDPTRVTLT